MDTEPLVFVGIDWASTEHQVCLTGTGDPVQRAFAHDAIGIGAMVDWLCVQAEQPTKSPLRSRRRMGRSSRR